MRASVGVCVPILLPRYLGVRWRTGWEVKGYGVASTAWGQQLADLVSLATFQHPFKNRSAGFSESSRGTLKHLWMFLYFPHRLWSGYPSTYIYLYNCYVRIGYKIALKRLCKQTCPEHEYYVLIVCKTKSMYLYLIGLVCLIGLSVRLGFQYVSCLGSVAV